MIMIIIISRIFGGVDTPCGFRDFQSNMSLKIVIVNSTINMNHSIKHTKY